MSLILAEFHFFIFLPFPEDIKYCSYKNKAGKKLEGSNISTYEIYVERSSTKLFSRNSGQAEDHKFSEEPTERK